jgi:dTDP-4-amino-4,6-dideoxygalactose transaminase
MAQTSLATDDGSGTIATAVCPAQRATFLPFSPPNVGEEEIAEIVDTLRSGWLTTGPKTKRFEQAFAQHLSAPGSLALNSCTAGLHLALVAGSVGPGDEVITTPMTFAASVNVIEHVGARPVLVDVEADTLNIDPDRVEAAITPATKAILPVHYAGHPADLDPLMDLAAKHDLLVVEDAAHALPARYKGRLIGSGTNPTSFSFYATKNLTTGEGGMLTGTPGFLETARCYSLHGMSRDAWNRYTKAGSWAYEVVAPGFKYNMTDMQAGLGLAQLAKLERFQRRRREIVNLYHDGFADLNDLIELPVERPDVEHAWHLYVIRLNDDRLTLDRSAFVDEMKARNIGTSVHFVPIHLHPYYRDKYGFAPGDFPVLGNQAERVVSLPLHPGMSDGDVGDVVNAVTDIVTIHRR